MFEDFLWLVPPCCDIPCNSNWNQAISSYCSWMVLVLELIYYPFLFTKVDVTKTDSNAQQNSCFLLVCNIWCIANKSKSSLHASSSSHHSYVQQVVHRAPKKTTWYKGKSYYSINTMLLNIRSMLALDRPVKMAFANKKWIIITILRYEVNRVGVRHSCISRGVQWDSMGASSM